MVSYQYGLAKDLPTGCPPIQQVGRHWAWGCSSWVLYLPGDAAKLLRSAAKLLNSSQRPQPRNFSIQMCPLFVPQIYNQTASSSSVVVGLPFLFSSLSDVTTTILGLKVGAGAEKRGAGGEASTGWGLAR